MSDLPIRWRWREVETNAKPPSEEWLTARVTALLAHFFQRDDPEAISLLVMADWIDALSDVPQEAIQQAIAERIRQSDRRKPIPGEIRERALARIRKPYVKPEAVVGPVLLTTEEFERRQQIMRDNGFGEIVNAPKLKVIQTCEGE